MYCSVFSVYVDPKGKNVGAVGMQAYDFKIHFFFMFHVNSDLKEEGCYEICLTISVCFMKAVSFYLSQKFSP